MQVSSSVDIRELNEKIHQQSAFIELLNMELNKAVVGQKQMVERLMVGLLANGHVLLEGVPGLAKTLAIKSLASAIHARFARIQFTPDLLPADLVGTLIYSQKNEEFKIRKGPIFANFILADEINRSPAKVQSALLEAMQERQVTLDGQPYALSPRFMVVATQNPIEQQGVYPLPEAQLDRFLFKEVLRYPSEAEERDIVARHGARTGQPDPITLGVQRVAGSAEVAAMVAAVAAVTLTDPIVDYVVALVRATRGTAELQSGASPRAAAMLAAAARGRAALDGRDYVIPDDVKALAPAALRHRVILSPAAEIDGRSTDDVVDALVARIEPPR